MRTRKLAGTFLEKVGLKDMQTPTQQVYLWAVSNNVQWSHGLAMIQMFLFDEPTSALTQKWLVKFLAKLCSDLAKSGDDNGNCYQWNGFAYEVADRVIFMDGGVIVEE